MGRADLAALGFDGTRALVHDYLVKLRSAGQSAQSLISQQRTLSRFFRWLMQSQRVAWPANPAARTFHALASPDHRPRPPVSRQALMIVLNEARATQIWPAVLLCLTTGFRPIGTTRIEWADVDLDQATVRVFEKKRERGVPLNAWVVRELRAWKDAHPVRPLSCCRNTLYGALRRIRLAHGLGPEVTLQGLRRTFISECMDKGLPAQIVASAAGNSVAVIERHYKDLRTLDSRPAVAAMDFSKLLRGRSKYRSTPKRVIS